MRPVDRREFSVLAGASLVAPASLAQSGRSAPIVRAIPSTGERVPVVGLGTANVFDNDSEANRSAALQVLRELVGAGGRLVDTASTYGDAERVLGSVIDAAGLRERLFVATKLEAADTAELERSLARLKTAKVDLLQLHNVRDPRQSLARFRAWKQQGLCRYIGITSTSHRDYAAIEAVLEREKPDFVQIDYSLDDRVAEARILPLATSVNAGVLTALPFGRGRLFRAVRGREIPDWARDFAASWAEFFLKYLIGDPRITAVIPGTSNPAHMADNLGAMRGRLPEADERKRMEAYVDRL